MIKEFSFRRNSALINFSSKYCQSENEILDSYGFEVVLTSYIESLEKKDALLLDYFLELYEKDVLVSEITTLMKLLLVLDTANILNYSTLLEDKDHLVEFIEGLYNYWRRIDRYAVIRNRKQSLGMQNVNFIDANNRFTEVVLKLYRRINETIEGKKYNVYRQLSAGVNAGIVLNESVWNPPQSLSFLKDVPFIESIILRPPFITYPKMHTRTGLFEELDNPFTDFTINPDHWFCYPAKVGEFLAYVYFHREYMVHGVTLCNLFELAEADEYVGKQPDLVYVFGAKNKVEKTVGYHYDESGILVGYANNCDEVDYFGYMKKMLLTLHNLKQIESKALPIHGAMVNVVFKNGDEKNIVIMGDSGAGKSESLEAFRKLSEKYLKNIRIIFDDMGTFKEENGDVIGYGTEIGAFVRLDDLENGYAYNEMDRAVFMNPNKTNARLVMPVATYKEIMHGYKVDMFLYANNYESGETLSFFDDVDDAIEVFKQGRRKAKGTTSESGVVDSYFANPFGMKQKEEDCNPIIDHMFNLLFDNDIPVGQILTKLGIDGYETEGPMEAAKKLFASINK